MITKLAQEIPALNVVNGFKATGIYDVIKEGPNKEIVLESLFKQEDLVRYKKNLPRLSSLAATITEALPQSSQSPLQQSEATFSALERQPDPDSTPSTSDPVSVQQTASTSRDLTVAVGPSKEFVVNRRKSFEDLLLEIMSKEKNQKTR